ncbi:hypothetical protein AALA98_12200 [Lachnospiraceae bacterium 45-W7]
MQSRYVRCIKIIHYPAEVRVYRELSAFFRFVGIFVCENLTSDEYGDKVDWVCRIEEGSEDGNEPVESQVKSKLEEMRAQFGEECFGILTAIWELFEENDLMRASYAVDYFSNTGRTYIYQQMERAMEAFETVLGQLRKLEQNREKDALCNVYLWMAKANCRRRIYELYAIIWNAIERGEYQKEAERRVLLKKLYRDHHIDVKDVIEDIQKVLDEDPQFFAAYAVRGFVKEIDDDYVVDSVEDIKRAVSMVEDKTYSSYLQYRIGRHYEKLHPGLNQIIIIDYYKKAASADAHNFRAIYKLALHEEDQEEYREAMELWKHILQILEIKRDLPSLQPIECAYLYKAYRKVGELYKRDGNYELGIYYLKQAERVFESRSNEGEEKGFYPWMFGTEETTDNGQKRKSWQVYKEAAREKLQIEKVYTAIADACARANMQEDHTLYMGKMVSRE